MGRTFELIDDELGGWISNQRIFFVTTAPLSAEGHVNCSPKGLDCFRILEPTRVAYLDLHGSGIETAAHVQENGRILIMFCAFEGPPRIVRLHGRGRIHGLGTSAYQELRSKFPDIAGGRSIVEVRLTRISDSCGFGVPRFEYVGQPETLSDLAQTRGEEGLARSRIRNRLSLDGLPGIDY